MDLAPQQRLGQMITGYWISRAVYVASKYGIADLLKSGPRGIDELAAETSTNSDALYRVLRALASVGVFAEGNARTFSLTPMAELLRSDVEGSLRSLSLMAGGEQFDAWGEVLYSVETGKTAFDKVFGKPVFDYLADKPEQARIFDEAMTGIHGRESVEVLDAYDFSGIKVLADVGGGNGSNLINILERYPAMKGILFDLPHVVERAKARIEKAGLSDRCQVVGGSFFESIPPGADAIMMRHIIHDWDEEKCHRILQTCRAALPAHGKLLLVECVIPPGNEPFMGKFLDIAMLVIPGGKERTADEYRALYDRAGFKLVRIVPTKGEMSVIEGAPT